jgi:hypothetical protein
MGPNKFVHLTFALGALLLAFVVSRMTDWAWSYFAKPNDLIINAIALLSAGTAAIVAYRNEQVFASVVEVTRELEKGHLANPKRNIRRDCRRHSDGADRGHHPEQFRCPLVKTHKLVP